MRIRLQISQAQIEPVRRELEAAGIAIDDKAPYVLSEAAADGHFLTVRGPEGERMQIAADGIIFIESYGHNVDVHTADGTYASPEPLYRLAAVLDPHAFLRISNSVIISKKHVKKIRPSFSMKFVLTLSDGTIVDVTRNYYSSFREVFNI